MLLIVPKQLVILLNGKEYLINDKIMNKTKEIKYILRTQEQRTDCRRSRTVLPRYRRPLRPLHTPGETTFRTNLLREMLPAHHSGGSGTEELAP